MLLLCETFGFLKILFVTPESFKTAAHIILLLSHTFRTIKGPVNVFTTKLSVVIVKLVVSIACPALPSRRQVGSECSDILSADIPEAIR